MTAMDETEKGDGRGGAGTEPMMAEGRFLTAAAVTVKKKRRFLWGVALRLVTAAACQKIMLERK